MEIRITHDKGHRTLHLEQVPFAATQFGVTVLLDNAAYAALVATIDAEEAWDSGDYETEPKTDERQTEAWLDGAPSYGGSD